MLFTQISEKNCGTGISFYTLKVNKMVYLTIVNIISLMFKDVLILSIQICKVWWTKIYLYF